MGAGIVQCLGLETPGLGESDNLGWGSHRPEPLGQAQLSQTQRCRTLGTELALETGEGWSWDLQFLRLVSQAPQSASRCPAPNTLDEAWPVGTFRGWEEYRGGAGS